MDALLFKRPPWAKFLLRMLPLYMGVFFGCCFWLGSVVKNPQWRMPGWVGLREMLDERSSWPMACDFYLTIFTDLRLLQGACFFKEEKNQLEKSRCHLFWSNHSKKIFLAALPFLGAFLVGLMTFIKFNAFYREWYQKLAKMNFLAKGIVTDPPAARQDLFAWFFCLKKICVELSSGEQLAVYLPQSFAGVDAGAEVAVLEGGLFMGKRKFMGVHYAPYVSVRGS